MKSRHFSLVFILFICLISLFGLGQSRGDQKVDPLLYAGLRYRLIGPFRASRTVAAAGIPSQPSAFFIGGANGGVWKTDDYGRTWRPIFDDTSIGSIGDIAVSPSRPETIYVGSGESLYREDLGIGDGIYKSKDGGRSWENIGLRDVQQVGRIVVHPNNPDIVFVAGCGHPFGPNEERGVFRTSDGGKTWKKVLYIDRNTGAVQVEFDPTNPTILFAALWTHQLAPWKNGNFSGSGSGLFKSTDGGSTWRRLTRGLPTPEQGLGRIYFSIAPRNPKRIYATVSARKGRGIYRSDDAGESWTLIGTDLRVRGYIRTHPEKPDVVFVACEASYRSDDGGKTWTCILGAPGGDDFQGLWINPKNADIMLLTSDQGATITINGGRTWSSWYNQPIAEIYHVTTDNQFPYWIYGGQQESGALGIASRGNGGQISFRDWMAVGAEEYAYVAPDPLNPGIVYGGRVTRFNKATGQFQNVAPEALRSGKYRVLPSMPLLFHPADPRMLLFATNVLWKTTSGGQRWQIISPDLSREQPELPENVGDYWTADLKTMARRGVIFAIGPSPLDVKTIWAGTDDGLVHVTRDGGKTWKNVTPPGMRAWDKVSKIDAGHFDPKTAYVAVNAMRLDDMRPYMYKTHDGGATWRKIVNGLNDMAPVNAVREDPKKPGLLYAGTEREVAFSIDDGENWQSLRMNMPATSVRDLVIHEDDLVVGTYGRSIWILDNIAPLREIGRTAAAREDAFLFAPPTAIRVRGNMFADTPMMPEEPAGQNPPEGAILDYYLGRDAVNVTLEIIDDSGEVVRKYSSSDPPERIEPATLPYPTWWLRPPQSLWTKTGHHRFIWDLRYAPPRGARGEREEHVAYTSIAAVANNTVVGPRGPFVHPDSYTVRLTVDGTVLKGSIKVRMDPRVKIRAEDLQLQTNLSLECYRGYIAAQGLREAIEEVLKKSAPEMSASKREELNALRGSGAPGDPEIMYGGIYKISPREESVVGLQHKLLFMFNLLQSADARPTSQAVEAVQALRETLPVLEQRWKAML